MNATRQPDGSIRAPKSAQSKDGKTVGVGWVTLRPGDPDYDRWDRWLRSRFANRMSDEAGGARRGRVG